jgi:hypothetical protein
MPLTVDLIVPIDPEALTWNLRTFGSSIVKLKLGEEHSISYMFDAEAKGKNRRRIKIGRSFFINII